MFYPVLAFIHQIMIVFLRGSRCSQQTLPKMPSRRCFMQLFQGLNHAQEQRLDQLRAAVRAEESQAAQSLPASLPQVVGGGVGFVAKSGIF